MNSLVDVRDVLGAVQAPTLVLHRRDDRDSRVEEGRFIAERIPGARFVELAGRDHFVAVDPDQILDPVEEFVRSLRPGPDVGHGDVALTTLLAVHVAEHIDPAWVQGLAMELVDEHRGEPGRADAAQVLATFDGPGRAVRCAVGLAARARAAGLHLAVGLHTAEVARRGHHVGGEAVRVAQAIADQTPAGEVWATSTVRDLLAGSGLRFEDRGEVATGTTPPVVRVVAALV